MLHSTGLGGDGDEVEAVELVEERLGLSLDYDDAPNWLTVGDLWNAICRARPELADSRVAWRKMVVALCWFTGVDHRQVGSETLLIDDTTMLQQLASLFERIRTRGRKNA